MVSVHQSGFCPGDFCVHQIISIVHDIQNAFDHSVHSVINALRQKHHPLFLAKSPIKSELSKPPSLFRQSSFYIGVSQRFPSKSQIF